MMIWKKWCGLQSIPPTGEKIQTNIYAEAFPFVIFKKAQNKLLICPNFLNILLFLLPMSLIALAGSEKERES